MNKLSLDERLVVNFDELGIETCRVYTDIQKHTISFYITTKSNHHNEITHIIRSKYKNYKNKTINKMSIEYTLSIIAYYIVTIRMNKLLFSSIGNKLSYTKINGCETNMGVSGLKVKYNKLSIKKRDYKGYINSRKVLY